MGIKLNLINIVENLSSSSSTIHRTRVALQDLQPFNDNCSKFYYFTWKLDISSFIAVLSKDPISKQLIFTA